MGAMADGHAQRRTPWLLTGLLLILLAVVPTAVASAHSGIAGSDPSSGAELGEPIDQVTIDFGTTIGDDTEIVVLDPDDEQLDTQLEILSDTEARVSFAPIEQHGTYIARYLTTSIADGHLLAGAISFTYGSTSSGPSTTAWILFGTAVVAILGLGALFTLRRHRAGRDGAASATGSEVDEDLSDVGV